MKDEAKDKFNNKSKKVRRLIHKRGASDVENQQQMDALRQAVRIAEDKTKQLETTLNTIRQANISSASKKKRISLLQSTCDNLIGTRKHNSAWIVLFDGAGNIITSAHSGVGHEFESIINLFQTGKSLKCIENALRNPEVIVSDNPMINCCDCPLSMLYYGIECISIRFNYHTSYGIITASLPHALAHDNKEQKFLREISESLSSALYTIELEDERKLIGGTLRESEEKYSTLVEQAKDGVTITQDGVIRFANNCMAETSRYSVEELTGMPTFKLVPPDFIHILEERFALCKKDKDIPEIFPTRLLCKDGKIKEMESSTRVIQYKGGPATLAIVRDITERKRAEEMLQESEERHRALVEAAGKAGTGIAILQTIPNREAAIVFANDQTSYISGYAHGELLSMSLKDVMSPVEYARIITRYRNRQKGMTVRGYYETSIICKDGTVLPVETSVATLKLHSGIATVVYFKEIASRKKAEEKIALHTKHMQAILSVAQMINQTPIMNKMLASALDKLNEIMSTGKACLYLIDFENKCLKMKSCRGLSDKNIRRYSNLKLTEDQLQNLMTWKNQNISFESIFGKTADGRLKAALERNKACSYVMVPLLLKDKVIGILYNISDKERSVTEDDVKFLTAIAYEISIGISSIQMLERTVEMSLTDALTGLYNRRHFYETLETEMSRTKRYGQPFSLILLDLDGFKEYNDKFGHTSGDGVLQLFANELRSSLRKTDIACRYGGDEFAIVLPASDSKSARAIIERFRIRWHKNAEKLLPIMKIPIDFSCGIAKFPDNSESADGLVFLADAAMYCAKRDKEHKSVIAAEISSVPSGILQAANQDHVYALAATVDAKDPHTYGHSKRVAAIAEKIGKAIGLSKEELSELYSAALLHDIGKIGVPDSILTKPDRLTPEEWAIIKNHSTEGANIVGYVKELAKMVPTILHHHEWYDGKGYPYGLKGNTIPIGARITSVADAYDTMTTERPYRRLVSPEQACEELNRCSGTQFDPAVVDILCKIIREPN
jgi:diguanylate cyclase (GGDEF)-like protein/PAS domain S-box-containing protein/putative nucleotidyltransferase with HDIG domain